MPQKHLLLTFDYELFLGERSGTPQDCLIDPTRHLLQVCSHHPLKMIFFVDTLYLLRLRDEAAIHGKCGEDFELVIEQLKELAEAGHYLFPHLHAHWLDAKYKAGDNEWALDNAHYYRLHAVDQDLRRKLFRESIGLLEQIVRSTGADYPIDAYRAGGWSIQPFDIIAPLFREFGIRYDFSVAARRWSFTRAHWFDFTAVQEANGPYRFSKDVTRPDTSGEFIQFPISFVETGKWSRRLDLLLRRSFYRTFLKPYGKGGILRAESLPHDPTHYPDLYYLQLASVENFRTPFISEYRRFIEDNDYLHFISHPKLLSRENLFWLDRMLDSLYGNHQVESDFRMMVD